MVRRKDISHISHYLSVYCLLCVFVSCPLCLTVGPRSIHKLILKRMSFGLHGLQSEWASWAGNPITTPVRWLQLLKNTVLTQSAIAVKSNIFLLSLCSSQLFVGIGTSCIGLIQIVSFFSYKYQALQTDREVVTAQNTKQHLQQAMVDQWIRKGQLGVHPPK